jgi:hypothetical protein
LLLCEYATIHKDGTGSIIRGGIETWTAALPLSVSLWLFVQVGANALPGGEHDAAVEYLSPQGLVLTGARLRFAIAQPDFPVRFVVPINASAQAYGKYTARAKIGSLPVAEVALIVSPESAP